MVKIKFRSKLITLSALGLLALMPCRAARLLLIELPGQVNVVDLDNTGRLVNLSCSAESCAFDWLVPADATGVAVALVCCQIREPGPDAWISNLLTGDIGSFTMRSYVFTSVDGGSAGACPDPTQCYVEDGTPITIAAVTYWVPGPISGGVPIRVPGEIDNWMIQSSAVPEPGSLALFAGGLSGLLLFRRSKNIRCPPGLTCAVPARATRAQSSSRA